MLKAIHEDGEIDVLILDPYWVESIDELRTLSRSGKLVCQECRQPVRVRSGEVRIRHFAHIRRENCSIESESSELLIARATLYEKLHAVFGDKVTIEKKIDSKYFSRPIDCWVEDGSNKIGYWIFDKTIKSDVRDNIKAGFREINACVNYVFTSPMLIGSKEIPDCIELTTTERDFMVKTPFDEFSDGKTLQYFDAENKILTTYHRLWKYHSPNIFSGEKRETVLLEITVSEETGELLHPGEYELLVKIQQQRAEHERLRIEKEKQRVEQERLQKKTFSNYNPAFGNDISPSLLRLATTGHSSQGISKDMPIDSISEKKAPCMYCGQVTSSWVSFDGKSGTCKCRECRNIDSNAITQYKIYFALDEHNLLVSPDNAEIEKKYRCPKCKSILFLQKDESSDCYFTHQADCHCSLKLINREIAKILIQKVVCDWKAGLSESPIILLECKTCHENIRYPLPEFVSYVTLDFMQADGSKIDVILKKSDDKIVVAISVSISKDGEEGLLENIKYIVLDNDSIIKNPYVWKPLHNNLTPIDCSKCRQH